MPEIRVTVQVEQDGQAVPGFPLVQRLTTEQVVTFAPYIKALGTFTSLPIESVLTVQALIVRTDVAATVRLDGQTDAGIPLQAGGLLLILNADIDAGAATNATISTAADATVRGLAAGADTA